MMDIEMTNVDLGQRNESARNDEENLYNKLQELNKYL